MFQNPIPEKKMGLVREIYTKRGQQIVDEETFLNWIGDANPDNGDHSIWLARLATSPGGGLTFPEDIEKIKGFLTDFNTLKKRGIIPANLRDTGQFKSYNSFYQAISPYLEGMSVQEIGLRPDEYKVAYRSERYLILEVSDWRAAQKLSQKTNWCTVGTGMAKHYTEDGPLYFIFRKNREGFEKFALLTNRSKQQQFRDTNDYTLLTNRYGIISEEAIRQHNLPFADSELLSAVKPFAPWVYCEESDEWTTSPACPRLIIADFFETHKFNRGYPETPDSFYDLLEAIAVAVREELDPKLINDLLNKLIYINHHLLDEYKITMRIASDYMPVICGLIAKKELTFTVMRILLSPMILPAQIDYGFDCFMKVLYSSNAPLAVKGSIIEGVSREGPESLFNKIRKDFNKKYYLSRMLKGLSYRGAVRSNRTMKELERHFIFNGTTHEVLWAIRAYTRNLVKDKEVLDYLIDHPNARVREAFYITLDDPLPKEYCKILSDKLETEPTPESKRVIFNTLFHLCNGKDRGLIQYGIESPHPAIRLETVNIIWEFYENDDLSPSLVNSCLEWYTGEESPKIKRGLKRLLQNIIHNSDLDLIDKIDEKYASLIKRLRGRR